MSSLFTWCHDARNEEIYNMVQFWEKPSDRFIRLGRPKLRWCDITILLFFWIEVPGGHSTAVSWRKKLKLKPGSDDLEVRALVHSFEGGGCYAGPGSSNIFSRSRI